MHVIRRMAAVLLALAVALIAPGLAGVAHADDDDDVRIALTSAQVTAVTAARADYLKTAWQAKTTYRAQVVDARDAMDAALQGPRLNVLLAKDAYDVALRYGGDVVAARASLDAAIGAYRSAYLSALATAQAAAESARATLRATLTTARATYVTAITAAFTGTSVPPELLNPPGPRMGWFHDHHGWKGLFEEFGVPSRFDVKWPMGMGWAWNFDHDEDDD